MSREQRYWPDNYYELVTLEDGVPVKYSRLGSPMEKSEESGLAERIYQLVGVRVSFGEWKEDPPGDPRDRGSEVPLFVVAGD